MKRIVHFLLFCLCITHSYAQTNIKDSLKLLLLNEKKDTSRVLLLANLSFQYYESKPDTAMVLALEALSLARQIDFEKGEAVSLNRIGGAYNALGNYPKTLEVLLQALKINEKINNLDGIQRNLNNIGLIYEAQEDYRQALDYSFKAKELAIKNNNKRSLSIILGNIGSNYYHLKVFDSARLYAQQSYDVAYEITYPRTIGSSLKLMGLIHSETGQNNLALEYYRLTIPYFKNADNDLQLSESFLGIAKMLEKTGKTDSVLFYANQGLIITKEKGFTKELLDVTIFLSTFYKNRKNSDSALFYMEVAKKSNDSLFNQQKVKQLQSLGFDEKLRQQEIAAADLKIKKERQVNLQYAAIALAIVIFFILFLLFSRSIITNTKVIEFFGVIALLIIFEFINLLLHPFLGRITHHAPLLMLLGMVCIAALLVPVHHYLQKWITHTIVEKNKRIRLAAAKKTIAKLEGEQSN